METTRIGLELDREKAVLLEEVLTWRLVDMRRELARTDHRALRDQVHARLDALEQIHAALRQLLGLKETEEASGESVVHS